MENLIVYIDGFNLYYGLRHKHLKQYYWLNLLKLSELFLPPNHVLAKTKYFTSIIRTSNNDKKKRQNTFLEALETLPNFEIYYGHYLNKTVHCDKCNSDIKTHEEKMTDVSIATELIFDAFNNSFDTAIIVSGDSDLVPPIKKIKSSFPSKKIGVGFPPNRRSYDLEKNADFAFEISRNRLKKSVFPETVTNKHGIVLQRPPEWK